MVSKKETSEKVSTAKKTIEKKAPAAKKASKTAKVSATATPKSAAKKPSARAGQPRGHRVAIKYVSDPGRQVFIAGSFNNWDATAKQLVDEKGTGEYFVRFLLKSGIYQYKLVVDGQWILDPSNPNTEPNEFGTQNNVLVVTSDID
ncbi:MAG: glycogen-binding domain-containing protein [Lentisphaeria bacterium]|nr:glycogen-binding domain-containing protein [Lentisphaeria bacterium]